ncbi:MAG TPA: membrane protein insertase YidC, partial [Rhizobiales bacterium]|nr:membrane protein insertase YidC [Hyphomicrobiales bacterium]
MQQDPDTQKNLFVAIALSMVVLFAWQYFFVPPKKTKEQIQQQAAQQARESKGIPAAPAGGGALPKAPVIAKPAATPGSAEVPGMPHTKQLDRTQALKGSPRILVRTPSLSGTISLKGGRIDDLALVKYRQTVDPDSPNVILFSPAGTRTPYFAEHGWSSDGSVKVPTPQTMWKAAGNTTLTPDSPVTLTYNNGEGQIFRRTIKVDENYLFTIRDEVVNNGARAIRLFPYARIRRTGMPLVKGFYILHEGLIGYLGEEGLQEITYTSAVEDGEERLKQSRPIKTVEQKGGWLGMTDKYWAAALVPPQDQSYKARLFGAPKSGQSPEFFQSDYITSQPVTISAGGSGANTAQLFAGAKKYDIIKAYGEKQKIERFDLMVDWGWFHFITKPLFYLIHWFYNLLGNFGLAILAVTVLVKAVFFPLANKSYESMSKMKMLQPQIEKMKERCGDDKVRLQKEMMELYKKEKVNPMSGCLPILLQIPVFFALYKVLFVTIDMRHAPFFGWIKDLSAPDPTTIFNLFGLLPYDVPAFIPDIGVWPIIMGITMAIQMQLNPQQPDPVQQMIFKW